MKRKLVSLFLALMMLLSVLPVTAFAAPTAINIVAKDAVYYSNGSLKSITATFDWGSTGSPRDARLILSSKSLNGSNPSQPGYGDFSDFGNYGKKFSSYEKAVAHDNTYGTFGFICATNPKSISWSNNQMTLEIPDNTISLAVDGTYYIYLWVTYSGNFYPDNLICVIEVQNSELKYTPAIDSGNYRNHYNPSTFTQVESKNKYNVTVIPGGNMTHDPASGAESQMQVASAVVPVIYNAAPGYYFPEDYSVAPVNGIMVKRLNDTQIQVYGTPTATTSIALSPASVKTNTPGEPEKPDHTCVASGWKWDETNHWQWICTAEDCQYYHTKTNLNAHVFTDKYDTTCNTCGYTRTAPAEHPNTGDSTHIPVWAMLFFGGAALMWVQLSQRKREQF